MPNAEQLLYQTEKSSHQRFSIKTCFLKINTYFEEHLCAAASELTLWSDRLEISGSHLKPSCFSNITKYKSLSNQSVQTKFGTYAIYIFNPYAFLWT